MMPSKTTTPNAPSSNYRPKGKELSSLIEDAVSNWIGANGTDPINPLPLSALELFETEQAVHRSVNALGGHIMEAIFNNISQTREIQFAVSAEFRRSQPRPWKNVYNDELAIRTRFGNRVALKTSYFHPDDGSTKKKGEQRGCHPLLIHYGLDDLVTPYLKCEVARRASEGSSFEAVSALFLTEGISICESQVRGITEAYGEQVDRWRNQMLKGDIDSIFPDCHGKLVIVETDGGRLKTTKKKRGRRKRGAKRAGRKTAWREPCQLMVKIVDPHTGEVDRIYDATMDSWHDTFRLLEEYLRLLKVDEATTIQFISDGARAIWIGVHALFDRLDLLDRVHFTLDFYHVVEKIWEIADLIKSWRSKRHRKEWVTRMTTLLREGKFEQLTGAVAAYCRGRNAGEIGKRLNYIEKHQAHINYPQLRDLGLPIGSGEIESAIRRIVNLRLKGPGIMWGERMAELMLRLRSFLKAGWWEKMSRSVWSHTVPWTI